jgi:hypothetical protein
MRTQMTRGAQPVSGRRHRYAGSSPTPGAAEVAGLRKSYGTVLQDIAVEPYLTVRETIARNAGYYPAPRDTGEVISLVGLTGQALQKARSLSGRQNRRLELAPGPDRPPGPAVPGRADHRLRPERTPGRLAARPRPARRGYHHHAHHALRTRPRRWPTGWQSSAAARSSPREPHRPSGAGTPNEPASASPFRQVSGSSRLQTRIPGHGPMARYELRGVFLPAGVVSSDRLIDIAVPGQRGGLLAVAMAVAARRGGGGRRGGRRRS